MSLLPRCIILLFALLFSTSLHAATSRKAMVVTADPHATHAAFEVLQKGGNAVDAAIAAQWVLNVVEPESSGIGGGGFFLFYEAATKRIYTLDGRETAPGDAYPEMFLGTDGHPYPIRARMTGGLPVGVPGVLKLLKEVHERFSGKKLDFASLFDPAIQIAEHGFPISKRLAHYLDQEKDRLNFFEDSRRIFLDKEGNPLPENARLVQTDLADTFRAIQKKGVPVFYEGEIAKDIVRAVREAPYHPGLMRESDLAQYKVTERDPVHGHYRGYDIFSMGPPSSGGTTLIETLDILELYDLSLLGRKADGVHLFTEAQKLAFQDRNLFLGDPDYSKIPVQELLSKTFAKERAQAIQFDTAIPTSDVPVRPLHLEGTHTTHLSMVDEDGNMVSFTSTIEHIFGSAMIVPGRGFFLNNELTDFEGFPRNEKKELHPNAPEGDKRPRSSMTPAFVFRDGKPVLVIGSPGGSAIIGVVLNVIVNLLDFEMPLSGAIRAPRILNRNGAVEMEPGIFQNRDLRRELLRRGHQVVPQDAFGNVQAIYFDRSEGVLLGESDPRGEGSAKGY